MPWDDVAGVRPDSFSLWNPGTNLFEVTVVRRNTADLVIRNLPLQTADRLRDAITDALRERHA